MSWVIGFESGLRNTPAKVNISEPRFKSYDPAMGHGKVTSISLVDEYVLNIEIIFYILKMLVIFVFFFQNQYSGTWT